jgi:pimeloyl-ACP methyl ester carboxylesterase
MAEIPRAKLTLLRESGHSLHTERADEVAALISAFTEGAGA